MWIITSDEGVESADKKSGLMYGTSISFDVAMLIQFLQSELRTTSSKYFDFLAALKVYSIKGMSLIFLKFLPGKPFEPALAKTIPKIFLFFIKFYKIETTGLFY